jgi:hypothetical protein
MARLPIRRQVFYLGQTAFVPRNRGKHRTICAYFLKGALLDLLFLSFHKTMEISGSVSLILVNPAPEKQFANLGQASALLFANLQKGSFDLTRDSEPDPFVFGCHKLRGF